jgi:hypothetical protein
MRPYCWDGGRLYADARVIDKQSDEADTVDIELEDDTEDVVEGDAEDVKSREPTEPELSSPRKPHRIRMPSKTEIQRAVESVRTESLEVDAVTKNAAQGVKVEDVD